MAAQKLPDLPGQWLNHWAPPFLVYALARNGKARRPSVRQLAEQGQLHPRTIRRLAWKITWGTTKLPVIDAFFKACGISPFHMECHRNYLRCAKKPMMHLTKEQLVRFNRAAERWRVLMEMDSPSLP